MYMFLLLEMVKNPIRSTSFIEKCNASPVNEFLYLFIIIYIFCDLFMCFVFYYISIYKI